MMNCGDVLENNIFLNFHFGRMSKKWQRKP
jgi:hypothetical protein